MGDQRDVQLSPRQRARQMVNGIRLQKVRELLGVTKAELGEVLGFPPKSSSNMYKLETGLTPICGLRLEVLNALEKALERGASVSEIWPRALQPRQRLTRIFALANPDEVPTRRSA